MFCMKSHLSSRATLVACALFVSACGTSAARPTLTDQTVTTATTTTSTPPTTVAVEPLTGTIGFEVLNTFNHDPTAFTQGLEFVDDILIESTGRRGESGVRIVDPETGAVLEEQPLDDAFFGEGITERDGQLYQLTWTSGVLFISDVDGLAPSAPPVSYEGEGWGICVTEADPIRPFVMSNGSAELAVRDPETFDVLSTVMVVEQDGAERDLLNELECRGDQVLANLWTLDRIVAIDLATGQIEGSLDLGELVPSGLDSSAVLNGIAYRESTDTYFVTGKLWPVMYELRLTSGG